MIGDTGRAGGWLRVRKTLTDLRSCSSKSHICLDQALKPLCPGVTGKPEQSANREQRRGAGVGREDRPASPEPLSSQGGCGPAHGCAPGGSRGRSKGCGGGDEPSAAPANKVSDRITVNTTRWRGQDPGLQQCAP